MANPPIPRRVGAGKPSYKGPSRHLATAVPCPCGDLPVSHDARLLRKQLVRGTRLEVRQNGLL